MNKTSVVTMKQNIMNSYYQQSFEQFCNALGIPQDDDARNQYRALGMMCTGLSILTAENLAKIIGNTATSTGTVIVGLEGADELIKQLLVFFNDEKSSSFSANEHKRHCAIVYTHLEEAHLRIANLIDGYKK